MAMHTKTSRSGLAETTLRDGTKVVTLGDGELLVCPPVVAILDNRSALKPIAGRIPTRACC